MKAQVQLALIVAASTLVAVGVYSFSLAYKVQSIARDVNEGNIIEGINQLELIKMAVNHSAVYSLYQSIYDITRQGGYENLDGVENLDGIPYWYKDEWMIPEFEGVGNDVNTNVFSRFGAIFQRYLQELNEKIMVALPDIGSYGIVFSLPDSEEDPDFGSAVISGSSDFKIATEKLELRDKIRVGANVKTNLIKIFKHGKDFVENKMTTLIVGKIGEANTEMEMHLREVELDGGYIAGTCREITFNKCGPPGSPESIIPDIITSGSLLTYCPDGDPVAPPDAIDEFKEKVKNIINGLDNDNVIFGSDTLGIEAMLSIKPDHIDAFVNEKGCKVDDEENGDCGCNKYKCPDDAIVPFTLSGVSEQYIPEAILKSMTVYSRDKCTKDFGIESGNVQIWKEKSCPNGFDERQISGENKCVQIIGDCNTDETLGGDCPLDKCQVISGKTINSCSDCTGEFNLCNAVEYICYKCVESCQNGHKENGECYAKKGGSLKTENKICESGTFEYNGNCYNCYDNSCELGTFDPEDSKQSTGSVCDVFNRLYTKTCAYEYAAAVTVLTKIKDLENSYPVFNPDEDSTAPRNSELRFYIKYGTTATPALLSPSDGASISTPIDLDWTDVILPGGWYFAYYKEDADAAFTPTVELSSSEHPLTLPPGTYQWNVTACNPSSECADSETWFFTIP